MIEFARIWAFALLPLPLLAWWLLPALPVRGAVVVPASVWQFLESLPGQRAGRRDLSSRLPILQVIGWLALVTALAGPMIRGAPLIVPTGRDLMIAVDVSASMGEKSAEADAGRRIDAVLALLNAFIERRKGDRVGLIAFGSEAHLIAPLSFDGAAVSEMLDELSIGLAGRRTDLGQAVGLAVKVLREEPEAERAIVVVSDGETNLGELAGLDAAALAARYGAKIHIIGFAKEIEAKNATHLAEIAQRTGGRFYLAEDAGALEAMIEDLDGLAPAALPAEPLRLVEDWTWLPLSAALVALAMIGWREARDP